MSLLLDTCAAIWFADAAGLKKEAAEALDRAIEQKTPVHISPITAWEIGMLAAKGRVAWPISPHAWFQRLTSREGIALAELTPELLIKSSHLPGTPPPDPADRIILATARDLELAVITRDRAILEYAEAGHVWAIGC